MSMQHKSISKSIIAIIFLSLLLVCNLSVGVGSSQNEPSFWNTQWAYRQRLFIPIDTSHPQARFQPIDMPVSFFHDCWAYNETVHSLRVMLWKNHEWTELESQIYDLSYVSPSFIDAGNLVFIIPKEADGTEEYWLYYHDSETSAPHYKKRVDVQDNTYSFTPLADVSIDISFYGVYEEGNCLYAVGQQGSFLRRSLSQVVVKQVPNSPTFHLFNVEQIASFSFSMQAGKDEADEISSEHSLVSKKIFTKGNLMVEFGIISESKHGEIRTTALYRYYYNPGEDKRIFVQVRHELNQELSVSGIDNLDGRFGAFITFKSRSARVDSLNFGEIFPSLYFKQASGEVDHYQMITNPQSKTHDWIIRYNDNAMLHKHGWIAYGANQRAFQSLIFTSTHDVVCQGTDEQDGIQLIVAVREYFNFLGTEIDYATINFGRNSYQPGQRHDKHIPDDLIIEYSVEFFTAVTGGIEKIDQESRFHRTLAQHRKLAAEDPEFEQQQKTFDVTVIPRFGGTYFTFPLLANITTLPFPVMWIELWQEDTLVQQGPAKRSLFNRAYKTFHNIPRGTYVVKVYYHLTNQTKYFRGTTTVEVIDNTRVHVLCTWQRKIQVTVRNQNDEPIDQVRLQIVDMYDTIIYQSFTDTKGYSQLLIPQQFRKEFYVKAYHGPFLVYNEKLPMFPRHLSIDFSVALYDIELVVRDTLGLPPGVPISVSLLSTTFEDVSSIPYETMAVGHFLFTTLPTGEYNLTLSYGTSHDYKNIQIPEDGPLISMVFSAEYLVMVQCFDRRAKPIDTSQLTYHIQRSSQQHRITSTSSSFPPGQYTIFVKDNQEIIGIKKILLTMDTTVDILTTVPSVIPIIVNYITVFAVGVLVLLLLKKTITKITVIKGIALCILVFSLVQPWWGFYGSNPLEDVEKTTELFIYPGVIIEETIYQQQITLDNAAFPDIVTTMFSIIFALVVCSIIFGIAGMILSINKKQSCAFILCCISVIVLIITCSMFVVVTDKISETSVGSIQGEGVLSFNIDEKEVSVPASWGLAYGFYCMVLAFMLLFITTIIDLMHILRKKNSQQSKT